MIDVSWDSDIKPALLRRYPGTTPEQLQDAHAYAYGGSVIQDIGYYPFGSHEFTDLLHYARTGDFVAWMIRDAQNVNQYAFALGALSHYVADVNGHPAVNAGVAIEYPKLRERYGKIVTYEEDKEAHLKTEFSFDVAQVAQRRYISKDYHDFIGFKVDRDMLERAFADTYGISANQVLHFGDLAVGSYRFAISRVIPEMTQVALAARAKQLNSPEKDDAARQQFLYRLSRADYNRDFGAKYREPGPFAKFIAFLLRLVPKFGPFKPLGYKDPTPQTEDLYFKSMNKVTEEFHLRVKQVESGDLQFPNLNLDTGELIKPGDYNLADQAYVELLKQIRKNDFNLLTPALKANLAGFFAAGKLGPAIKPKEVRQAHLDLSAMESFEPKVKQPSTVLNQ
ncbi:MAG: zinc dependent phospholipase C family protein [Acidobacteriales bacterium]|nr:zinc dependent phospholipase C family protein [Terriglobales bacterium]